MSSRRSVPVGVQFITGVGGFAAGLVALSSLLLLGLTIREGDYRLALQVLPMLALGVGHVVSLYGLVTLRQWGYRWTRRLFAVTLLVHVPAVRTGNPVQVGTLLFSGFVLTYLWLLRDSSVFTASPAADTPAADDPGDGPVEVDPLGNDSEATTIDVDPLDGAGTDPVETDHDDGTAPGESGEDTDRATDSDTDDETGTDAGDEAGAEPDADDGNGDGDADEASD